MRIMFVTGNHGFDTFEKEYEVTSAGRLPSLSAATAVLGNDRITPPEVVFIGPDMPLPKVIRFIRTHSTQAHLTGTRWLVVTDPSTHFMADELNGIAKIMAQAQAKPAHLAAALGIRHTKTARTLFATAINIKGGTGKTTLLTNLAAAFARRGLRTALIDTDVVDGDVALALGVPRTNGTIDKLASALSKPDAQKGALLKQFLFPRSENLYIIPAPGRSDYRQDYLNEITAQLLLNALAAARFEVVLVDLPGHLRSTPFTQSLARQKLSKFFLLYHPEKVFERDGFNRALQVLQGLKAQDKALIIALGSEWNNLWTTKDAAAIETSTGLQVSAFLPHDPVVRRAQAHRKPVYEWLNGKTKSLFGKGSPYGHGIEQLADTIVARQFGAKKQ